LQPRHRAQDPAGGRREGRWCEAGDHHRLRHRQATRRAGGGGDSVLQAAGAIPGQGYPLSGRIRLPQGRQEEVGTGSMGALTQFERRRRRVRSALLKQANGRPRLSVFRSSKHIYAQIIDDSKGATLAAASSLDKELKGKLRTGADKAAAAEVGRLVAERAVKAGVEAVVFDRGGYKYHGRVKALADAAREGGLKF